MTRKEADALISYIEFLAALTEDYELMNRPPVLVNNFLSPEQRANIEDNLRESFKPSETWTPSNPFDVTPRPITTGMDFGTEDGAKCAAAWRDQFDKWHIEEAGPIDPEAFKKLKTSRRGDDVQLGTLLRMMFEAEGKKLTYPGEVKNQIFKFAKLVRDLTELELKEGATTRFKCPNPEGAVTEALILWPSLSVDYIYLPKDHPLC